MTGKKNIFLFLALLLPVCVFVFLKLFGKNEFAVPLPYEHGVNETVAGCSMDYGTPYLVADSISQTIDPERRLTLVAIDFSDEQNADVESVVSNFNNENVELRKASQLWSNHSVLLFVKNCVLLLKAPNSIVLLDDQRQIRGYYNGHDLDDLDRLEAEIKIILKKY